jgi:hypothetical protein
MRKVCRILSNRVASNIHIDDFNKAMIVVAIRAKEEYVLQLQTEQDSLLQITIPHLRDNITVLEAKISDVANCGVEDERIGYVVVQIDRALWDTLKEGG